MKGETLINWFIDYACELDIAKVSREDRAPVWLTMEQCKSIDDWQMVAGIPVCVYGIDDVMTPEMAKNHKVLQVGLPPFLENPCKEIEWEASCLQGKFYPQKKPKNFCPKCGEDLR